MEQIRRPRDGKMPRPVRSEALPKSMVVIMSQAGEYPTVTEQLLDEVVRRIRQAGSPRAIVLIGSRARGTLDRTATWICSFSKIPCCPATSEALPITTPLPASFRPRTSWFTRRKKCKSGLRCRTHLSPPH